MSPANCLSQPFCNEKFFAGLAEPFAVLELFDCLPGTYMYVKDRQGLYMHVNRVVCEVMGHTDPRKVLGRTDFDFFPPAIAAQYIAEDQRVIETGVALKEQVWLVPGAGGVPQWYLCNKIPLRDRRQRIAGIAGVKRPYEQTGNAPPDYLRLLKVTEFVTAYYAQPISMQDLADQIDLSVSQLQREFKRLFGLSPGQYLQEVRVGVARRLLESGDEGLANIAAQCGFYDQSHFTRQFKSSMGMTPLAYRRRFVPTVGHGHLAVD